MIDLSLLPDFVAESVEHLEEMETNLLKLEASPGNLEILNDIFRSVHTIKGASEYMGMIKMAELSHKLETLLDMVRKEEMALNREIVDTLIDARDMLTLLVNELEQSQEEQTDPTAMIGRIERLSNQTASQAEAASASDDESSMDESSTENESTEDGSELEDVDLEDAIERAVDDVMESSPAGKAPTDPEDEPDAALVEEISGDDIGDPELFTIFTNQLNEAFSKIDAHLADPPRSDALISVLDQCTHIIETLHSSANYMGYDNLTRFYENWIMVIKQAQLEAFQDGKLVWPDFVRSRMKPYINKIVGLFPQLQKFRVDPKQFEGRDDAGVILVPTEEPAESGEPEDTAILADGVETDEMVSVVETTDLDLEDDVDDFEAEDLEKALDDMETDDDAEAESIESVIDKTEDASPPAPEETEPEEFDQKGLEAGAPSETDAMESQAAPTPEEDQALFDKLASAYDFHHEDHTFGTGEGRDIIDANLFSTGELTPEGAPEVEPREAEPEEAVQAPPDETLARDQAKLEPEPLIEAKPDEPQELIELTASDEEAAPTPSEALELEDETEGDALAAEAPSDDQMETPAATPEIETQAEIDAMAAEEPSADQMETPAEPPESEALAAEAPSEDQLEEPTAAEPPQVERPQVADEAAQALEAPGVEAKDGEEPPSQRKAKQYGAAVKKSVRVDAKKIDDLMNQVGELVVSRAWFSQLYNEMRDLQQYLKETSRLEQKEMKQVRAITFRLSEATVNLGRVATELQEGVMRVRMLPISQLFNRYPRLVRDLIHDTPKKVALDIRGEDTELDKMIIEKISDPLIHIMRNAVDHGIETTEERRRAGKSETGKIILEAYHESNHVVIEIRDDGQGINPEAIKRVALEREFVTADELAVMSRKDITSLILKPGFSTAAKVTHTSGRGVGMDVVKKNIEKLNGTLEIDSKQGVYTQLRIKIPLTLAIIPALLVRVGQELYTIPLATVEETLRIAEEDTTTIEGNEVIYIRNVTLPLVRLSELFSIAVDEQMRGKEFVVIVSTGLKKIGLVVEDLIGQEEVVIKPLEDYLQEKSGFSGATILGDGRVSLILDVYELANLTIERVTQMRGNKLSIGDIGGYRSVNPSVSERNIVNV